MNVTFFLLLHKNLQYRTGGMAQVVERLPSKCEVAHACNSSYLGGRDQEDCG
jgi:hypothetical protein